MILALIAAAWVVSALLDLGMCRAAASGDRELPSRLPLCSILRASRPQVRLLVRHSSPG
jgi:hypothetical protein